LKQGIVAMLESEFAPPIASPDDLILVFRTYNRFAAPAFALILRPSAGGYEEPEMLPRYDDGGPFSYGQLNAGSIALARTILRACVSVEDSEIWAENFARRILCQKFTDAWHMTAEAVAARVAKWNAQRPDAKFRAGAVLTPDDDSEAKP